MPRNYYVSGGWNVICDSCGKKIKASEAKQRWDGLIVCPADFEMRQPQDFVKARQDKITVPFTRPRPTDAFILVQGVNDPIQTQDTLTTESTYLRTIQDIVMLSDATRKTNSFSFADILLADDGSDAYIDPTYFLEDYVSYNPLGGFSILYGKPVQEIETVVDAFAKQYNLNESESMALLEYVIDTYSKQTSDSISLVDNVSIFKRNLQFFSDSETVTDFIAFATTYIRAANETVTATDNFDFYKARLNALSDTTTVSDQKSIKPQKTVSDTTTVADSGNIYYNNYISPTYFASDYIGTYTSI